MKKKSAIFVLTMVLCSLLSTTAYANSSWHWLTKTVPFDILPYAIVWTLVIEYVSIKIVNSIKHPFRLLLVICVANLASFLSPFAVLLTPSAVGYTFEMSINHLPKYIIGLGYLCLTLVVEVPIVYVSLKNVVESKKKLFISIVVLNIVTTVMVAVIERIFCRGSW